VKVTVVGAGMVGATTAMRLLEDRLADDLVVVDVIDGLARAVALDLCQSAPVRGHGTAVCGGSEYGPTEGSDLVVVTAGLPRGPGQSRADLLSANAQIVGGVADEVARRSPGAIIVVVTNPLDEMTTLAWRVSGFPSRRVLGMAGVLDTSRFRYFVAAELGTSPDQVEAVVLGSHGETMVPLPRHTRVSGRPLAELLAPDRIQALVERTRDAGAEIVALLQRGSAWFAPSAAIADMVGAIARDERRVVSACAYLEGQYGLSGIYLGVPARLGRGGVEEIVELPLAPDEIDDLRAAAETVRSRVADLERLVAGPARSGDGAVAVVPDPHDGSLADLRLRSRVRRAAEVLLWERGTPPDPEMLDALTDAAVEQLAREP